jgi:hypothetical protein
VTLLVVLGLLGFGLIGLGAWLEHHDTYPRVTDAATVDGWKEQTPESP